MTPSTLAFSLRNLVKPLISLLSFALAATAFGAPVKFTIPAQSAPAALKLFIKQSGTQVAYSASDLKEVNTNEVMGEYEPDAALTLLLKGSGFTFNLREKSWFVIVREKAETTTGSVKGSLTGEGGKGLPNVLVAIKETAQSTETDRYGVFAFSNVAAGTYVLVASAPGYQTMHIDQVQVKARRELTLGKEDMRKAGEGPLALEPFVVHADTVEQLEKFEVTGTKQKPFEGANVDIPRTINDAQPYYIFDSKTIEQSGAANVEDLLKQRLTMNTTAQTNAQIPGPNTMGNISSINLRGLGTNETLILVDGRRIAGVDIQNAYFQPDVNGIPLSAIERIEVLPSSASGIYGGSAIGGVVNIILKKDYVGGEIRATYDNTWNTDSPNRSLSANYGMSLEGGKTHVMLNASWSDAQPLLLQDRVGILLQNRATVLKNYPSYIISISSRNPFLGALPNIAPSSRGQTALMLKSGTVISSRNTYVPAGTSPSTSTDVLYTGLAANGGSWNLDLPATAQSPTGLLQPFGTTPETKSFSATVRRQMFSNLEIFADLSYNENRTGAVYNPFTLLTVPASSPVNPFTTAVRVAIPSALAPPVTTNSIARSLTLGAIGKLPLGWTGEFDYSWSQSRFAYAYGYTYDSDARTADLASGALNPFVDTLLYPLNLEKYLLPLSEADVSNLNDFALRGSGPLWSMPWSVPTMTIGLEHRIAATPQNNSQVVDYPLTPINDVRYTFFGKQQVTDSAYGEAFIPLVKKDWLPLVHSLELQIAGRTERYTVDTGSFGTSYYPNQGVTYYGSPTVNGLPYFSKATYTSTNGTIGLKYQPTPEITLRASLATAFLPPTPDQLLKNPLVDDFPTTVIDPKTGGSVDVQTLSGGNPGLKPQSSKSFNAGMIWEPRWSALKGLRFDAEYYRIEQNDAIGNLSAQQVVNLESTYPGRVTRDASGTITLVDTSNVNLYKLETEGWDLSADYTLKTGVGTFSLNAAQSIILHLKTQYALTLPEYEAAGYSAVENGAPKYKSHATLTWEWHGWTAAWTTRYISSYKQYGAAGGPDSLQNYGGATDTSFISAQGSDTIPSQTYHDIFLSYAFDKRRTENTSRLKALGDKFTDGLTVQLGARNVFDKAPPFDFAYSPYYESPYGDMRLRSYWLSVKKAF